MDGAFTADEVLAAVPDESEADLGGDVGRGPAQGLEVSQRDVPFVLPALGQATDEGAGRLGLADRGQRAHDFFLSRDRPGGLRGHAVENFDQPSPGRDAVDLHQGRDQRLGFVHVPAAVLIRQVLAHGSQQG
jgi:hypothetical protein